MLKTLVVALALAAGAAAAGPAHASNSQPNRPGQVWGNHAQVDPGINRDPDSYAQLDAGQLDPGDYA
jgi:hypothetical protein